MSPNLSLTYRALDRFAPLNRDQEAHVVGLFDRDPTRAQELLVLHNLRLVYDLAKRYFSQNDTLEDLIHEGILGLIEAARRFDPAKGNRFSTVAHWWIRRAISRYVKGPGRTIRLPEYISDQVSSWRQALQGENLAGDVGKLARWLERDPKEIQELLQASEAPLPFEAGETQGESLSARISTAGPAPDAEALRRVEVRQLGEWMKTLPERDRDVLVQRYGLEGRAPQSFRHIGAELGVSAERARQIHNTALRRLSGYAA